MSCVHICDRCGEQITAENCPEGKQYVVKIGGWRLLGSPITFNCDNFACTIDLCKACNDELMIFLGIDKIRDNVNYTKDETSNAIKDPSKDKYNRWDVRNE